MTPLTEEQLRAQLERRLAGRALDGATRQVMLSTIDGHVRSVPQQRTIFGRPLFRWAPAVAGLVVLLIAALIVLPQPATLPRPATSPSPALSTQVLSAEELAEVVASGSAIGSIVVADVRLIELSVTPCPRLAFCARLAVIGQPQLEVTIAGGPTTGPGPRAFRVEADSLVHLGVVELSEGRLAWTVPELEELAASLGETPTLYAIRGWLVRTAPVSCPAPIDEGPTTYWCGGSWLTAEAEYGTDSDRITSKLVFEGGLHVQQDAYDYFAPNPDEGMQGAIPREGTYLIRNVGCPPNVMGDCPVWGMIGRVDPPAIESREPTPIAPEPPPSPDANAASLARARAVLDQWEQAVKAAPEGAIAFTGFLLHGGGWQGLDADEQKSAFLSGLIEASVQLPTDVPPPGDVVWEDGSRATVPLISAADAFEQMRRGLVGGSCPECRPLEVVGARLVTRGAETSRGWADVPAWEFAFARRDAPTVPVTQVAVRDRIDVPRTEDVARFMGYALGKPDSTSLTVGFAGSACGPDHYTAEAVESAVGVVVLVQPDPPPAPDATPQVCIAMAVGRTAVVELATPLGSRTVLDPISGQPITLYPELPEDGFPRP